MKIYSDILDTDDLRFACPRGVSVVSIEEIPNPRTINPATEEKFKRGWVVYLTGSSCHRSQNHGGAAATWDEVGIWMVELYRRDPKAKLAWYPTHEDFIRSTTKTRDFYANENTMVAREHRAPWLDNEIPACPSCGSTEPDCEEDCEIRLALPRVGESNQDCDPGDCTSAPMVKPDLDDYAGFMR